jgi:hypothetical protein
VVGYEKLISSGQLEIMAILVVVVVVVVVVEDDFLILVRDRF